MVNFVIIFLWIFLVLTNFLVLFSFSKSLCWCSVIFKLQVNVWAEGWIFQGFATSAAVWSSIEQLPVWQTILKKLYWFIAVLGVSIRSLGRCEMFILWNAGGFLFTENHLFHLIGNLFEGGSNSISHYILQKVGIQAFSQSKTPFSF